jgi:hypothetical protein
MNKADLVSRVAELSGLTKADSEKAVDGVFEALQGDITADPATPPGVVFHPASGIDAAAVAQVQVEVRTRILRAFAGRGLIERFEAREMLAFKHSGF